MLSLMSWHCSTNVATLDFSVYLSSADVTDDVATLITRCRDIEIISRHSSHNVATLVTRCCDISCHADIMFDDVATPFTRCHDIDLMLRLSLANVAKLLLLLFFLLVFASFI